MHRDRPEREPDQVRERKQQAEEDGHARAAQIVRVADEVHRMLRRPLDAREHRRRVGVRISVGDEQQRTRAPARRSRRCTRPRRAGPSASGRARGSRTSRARRPRSRARSRCSRRPRPLPPAPPAKAVLRRRCRRAPRRARGPEARGRSGAASSSAAVRTGAGSRMSIGYSPSSPTKPGIRVRHEPEIRGEVREVADVRAEEAVQRRRAACRRSASTTQFAIAAKKTAIDQRTNQMKCGIARISRKKTVSRLRCRSSSTTSWTGCSLTDHETMLD